MQSGKRIKKDNSTTITNAVIYCRVSSQKQVTDGNGLISQEHKCRQYAKDNNLTVTEVFHERGISGNNGLSNRPALTKLFEYVLKSKSPIAIIVDDLNRWSRNVENHYALRASLEKHGAKLLSVNQNYEESPTCKLMEGIHASISDFERVQNKLRVGQRMKARLEQGYCPWSRLPCGFKRVGTGANKHIVKDEPAASIMAEVFTGFANGRFVTQQHVIDWLKTNTTYRNCRKSAPTLTWLKRVLQNPLYAGYVSYKKWGVDLTIGAHEPIVSMDIFEQVQAKLAGRPKHKIYETKRPDFPLRGYILCNDCGQPLTGSWCNGNGGKYPYYYCKTKGCKPSPRSVRTRIAHEQLSELFDQITPKPQVIKLVTALVKNCYKDKAKIEEKGRKSVAQELGQTQDQLQKMLDALLDEDNAAVKAEIRKRIEKLQMQEAALKDKMAHSPTLPDLDAILKNAVGLVSRPKEIWQQGDLEQKEMVLNLAFNGQLQYKMGAGFKTADISMPFNALGGVNPPLVVDGGA